MEAGALIAELKRRRVIRALIGYGIAAFAVLQIIEPVMHGLRWRDEVLSYVVVALAVGFPIVVSLAWIFDVNAGHIERTGPAQGIAGTRLVLVLVGIGLIVAAPGLVWYFAVRGIARRPEPHPSSATMAQPSIAVLPFADMSPAHDQEYFSDGIAEQILDDLAQVDGLKVIGRTSSFMFKGKGEDLRAIGEKLAVGSVLEGSVRKEGSHVRITAQLIASSDGSHIWSSSYDREMTGVLALQDEIARAVVEALKVKLLPGKLRVERKAVNPDAYAQFLVGMQLWRNGTDANVAFPVFEKATSLDPTFAPARAIAGQQLAAMAPEGESLPAKSARQQRALMMAEQAVALDPSSPDALAARGTLRQYVQWDWQGAQEDLDHARAAAPGSAYIVRFQAHLLKTLGHLDDAIRTYRLAVELDPLFRPSWEWLAAAYVNHGDYALARDAYQRAYQLRAEQALFGGVAWTYVLEHRLADAEIAAAKVTDDTLRLVSDVILEQERGHAAEARAALHRLITKVGAIYPTLIAECFAWQKDRDQAFEWLNRAYEARDSGLVNDLKVDVALRLLRDDPRYNALLKKMNLPVD